MPKLNKCVNGSPALERRPGARTPAGIETRSTDLRQRLDQSEQERRDKDRQLTALLTDQRERVEQAAPELQPRPGLFGRLFGKRA